MFSNSSKPLPETEFPPIWRVSNDKEIIQTGALGSMLRNTNIFHFYQPLIGFEMTLYQPHIAHMFPYQPQFFSLKNILSCVRYPFSYIFSYPFSYPFSGSFSYPLSGSFLASTHWLVTVVIVKTMNREYIIKSWGRAVPSSDSNLHVSWGCGRFCHSPTQPQHELELDLYILWSTDLPILDIIV